MLQICGPARRTCDSELVIRTRFNNYALYSHSTFVEKKKKKIRPGSSYDPKKEAKTQTLLLMNLVLITPQKSEELFNVSSPSEKFSVLQQCCFYTLACSQPTPNLKERPTTAISDRSLKGLRLPSGTKCQERLATWISESKITIFADKTALLNAPT